MRKVLILLGLLLEGVLVVVAAGLSAPALAGGPGPDTLPLAESPTRLLNASVSYTRVQVVTLQPLPLHDIYATAYTTIFQFEIVDYELPRYVQVPSDAITKEVSCIPAVPPCVIIWDPLNHRYYFSGTGKAHVYLHYDTSSRAMRSPGSRLVTLQYPVGPVEAGALIRLTNTVIFSRSADFGRQLEPAFVAPTGSTHNEEDHWLRWVFTSTPRLEFTAIFTEPLLGSDLVMDRLEMSPERPEVGQTVHYTAVVRNQGDYGTGRAVLAELFVRPYALGPPVVLTDHVGGWSLAGEDALFKWYSPALYQVYLPLVTRAYQAGSSGAHASVQAGLSGSYWWSGLEPGEVITGMTSFPWPEECGARECGVWAKVDPSYMEVGAVYQWWGYNPEGLDCGLGEDGLPTCEEESNNIAAAFTRFLIYMPAVLRGQ